ncbi:MAG TPA: nuclear transport factor 2 family protein [Cyclobacteriaceae bacterium]|jgi:ketosteroid isomerase-like protein|nr:nuclear transport factor 2 family protein [Cyclobacteriaceae bacterium]
MKHFLLSSLFCTILVYAQSQSAEKIIKTYYAGYETKDWNTLANTLADDFTFTSPNGDDHLNIAQYKERCWSTAKYFKTIAFPKIVVDGNTAFAMYDITTTDNKTVHNVEYYTFRNGKIKSIECFFGAGIKFPGNTK